MRMVYKNAEHVIGKKAGDEVRVGDLVQFLHNSPPEQQFKVVGLGKPHSPGSTGRVHIRTTDGTWEHSVFPSIIGAEWIERTDR
jgi:hypothetical protein